MFADLIENDLKENKVIALFNYHSNSYLKKQPTKAGDPFSKMILDVKDMAKTDWIQSSQKIQKKAASVHLILSILKRMLNENRPDNVEFVVIPSSTKDNLQHGISKLTERLSRETVIPFSATTLERTETIIKGSKDVATHLRSLRVTKAFTGKTIILLDDVTTTKTSFRAAHQKLTEAGAGQIYFLALGQTVRYDSNDVPQTVIERHWEFFRETIETISRFHNREQLTKEGIQNRKMINADREKKENLAANILSVNDAEQIEEAESSPVKRRRVSDMN
jgi:pyrimidine operon attenuation protein/uracil phosphoribosyltransferase